MGEFFTELNRVVPHFQVLVVASLLILGVQLLLLRTAQRRRPACLALEKRIECDGWPSIAQIKVPSWWPALLAGASAAGIPALGLWSFATARRTLLAAITNTAPGEKAGQLSLALGGMFNAIPLTIGLFLPCAILAIVSATLILANRAHACRLIKAAATLSASPAVPLSSYRGPGSDNLIVLPAMLFVGGLVPVISAAWNYSLAMIHRLSTLADAPIAAKVPHLLATLDHGHAILVGRGWLLWPGIGAATAVGAALLVYWGRRWQHGPSWQSTLLISLTLVVGAVSLFILAAPYRAENRLPWPPPASGGDRLLIHEPASPPLNGPDEIQRAVVLWLNEKQHTLDGYLTDASGLEFRLRAHEQAYHRLNPDGRFVGTLLVLSSADLPMRTLMNYLSAAARAQHIHATFTFTKRESVSRPLLGELSRLQVSGARATLVDQDKSVDADYDVVLTPGTFRTYGEFAHRLVELRRAGRSVGLRID